mmetsp:Transcript_1706/g.4308  ORF Transcript_1706/g.4308 Transcript_1706/m.4308 type:complete len:251 (+) Transcript_1706:619-1371(+)
MKHRRRQVRATERSDFANFDRFSSIVIMHSSSQKMNARTNLSMDVSRRPMLRAFPSTVFKNASSSKASPFNSVQFLFFFVKFITICRCELKHTSNVLLCNTRAASPNMMSLGSNRGEFNGRPAIKYIYKYASAEPRPVPELPACSNGLYASNTPSTHSRNGLSNANTVTVNLKFVSAQSTLFSSRKGSNTCSAAAANLFAALSLLVSLAKKPARMVRIVMRSFERPLCRARDILLSEMRHTRSWLPEKLA